LNTNPIAMLHFNRNQNKHDRRLCKGGAGGGGGKGGATAPVFSKAETKAIGTLRSLATKAANPANKFSPDKLNASIQKAVGKITTDKARQKQLIAASKRAK
jgi:hypothetical protein